MRDQDNDEKTRASVRRTIKSEAQRAREQLRQFQEARKAKEEALRREQEELANALKEAEKRERRRQTTERLTNEKRIKYALGGLVLAKIRAFPGRPLQFGNDDLRMLSDKDRERLLRALSKIPAAHAASTSGAPEPGPHMGPS